MGPATGTAGSRRAPTTTWGSRSPWRSWSPASARCCAAVARSGARPRGDRRRVKGRPRPRRVALAPRPGGDRAAAGWGWAAARLRGAAVAVDPRGALLEAEPPVEADRVLAAR